MVAICTASLTFNNATFCPHSVFMCFVWISEQTAIISLYSINWLVCITERECIYCAVRTGSLNILQNSVWFKFWFFKLWHADHHQYAKQIYWPASIKRLKTKEQKNVKVIRHEPLVCADTEHCWYWALLKHCWYWGLLAKLYNVSPPSTSFFQIQLS